NRRAAKRFDIRCPITLEMRLPGRPRLQQKGILLDIGEGGASVSLEKPVPVGTRVVLTLHLACEERKIAATMRFEATVLRSGEALLNHTAIRFRNRGRFLRGIRQVEPERTPAFGKNVRSFPVSKSASLLD